MRTLLARDETSCPYFLWFIYFESGHFVVTISYPNNNLHKYCDLGKKIISSIVPIVHKCLYED